MTRGIFRAADRPIRLGAGAGDARARVRGPVTAILAGTCGLAAAGGAVAANELAPWASLGATWSDNLLLSATNPQSATTLEEIAGLRVRRQGAIDVRADAQVVERQYSLAGISSETLPYTNLYVTGNVVPERFAIVAEDNLGQLSTQPFDSLSQQNRENVNNASIGPDVFVPVSARNLIDLTARVGQTRYQKSLLDSDNYTGDVSLVHLITPRARTGVKFDYDRIDYRRSDLYPNATKDSGWAFLSVQGARTYLALEAGEESLRVGQGAPQASTPHASIALQRAETPVVTLTAEYSHGFSTASESLRSAVRAGLNPGATQNIESVADPFRLDRAYVALRRIGLRTSLIGRVSWEHDSYTTNQAFNRSLEDVTLTLTRQILPLWTLSGEGRWSRQQEPGTSTYFNGWNGSIGLTRRISRSFQIQGLVQHTHTIASTGAGYQAENRVSLMVGYTRQGTSLQTYEPTDSFHYYEYGGGARPVAVSPNGSSTPGEPSTSPSTSGAP